MMSVRTVEVAELTVSKSGRIIRQRRTGKVSPAILHTCGNWTLYGPEDNYCAYCAVLLPNRKPFRKAVERNRDS